MIRTKRRLEVVSSAKGAKVTANIFPGSVNFTGGPGMTSVSAFSGQGVNPVSMLLGVLSEDEKSLQAVYTDIYNNDNLCGTAIDLKATLPVSDFTLTGLKKDDRVDTYLSNVHRLGYPGIMPQVYTDFYARGKHISTLIHNSELKLFTDQMVHSAGDCTILNSPLHGIMPLIKLKPNEEVKKFLNDASTHCQEVRKRLNPEFVASLLTSEVTLDPLATLYVPRPGLSGIASGQSMFRRIIPLFLLEKLLYRGTLAEAQKRQRSTLHIMAGGENWQPIEEELHMLVGLFQQADLDPTGAIVATRNDVQTSEIRSGGDFWKYTDVTDIIAPMKMRILGLSESFLSGESSYNAMEVALSVFIENMRSDREYVTRSVFYEKLFPLIAHVNEFYLENKVKHHAVLADTRSEIDFDISDTSKYDMPKIHWTKSLRPEADRDYMEVMGMLEEKGVPIPLAMQAAAGGMSIDDLMKGFDDDLAIRKKVAEYQQQVKQLTGGNDMGEEEARTILEAAGVLPRTPRSILNRDYGELSEVVGRTVTGKKKYIHNQRGSRKKMSLIVAKAMQRLADPAVYAARARTASKLTRNGQLIQSDGSIINV